MEPNLETITDYLQISRLSKSMAPLLYALLSKMNLEGTIVVNATLKRHIGDDIDMSLGSIDNMIGKIREEGVLERVDRGIYRPRAILLEIMRHEPPIEMTIIYGAEEKEITIRGGNVHDTIKFY